MEVASAVSALALASWLSLHGCSAACGAGIIANLERESGLDPAASSRTGVGLPGWAGPRRRRMQRLLGAGWRDGVSQLRHIVVELGEFGVRDRLFGETDPGQAAMLFFHGFEWPDPKKPLPAGCARRALELYRVFVKTGVRA